jgi:DNA helicase-4
MELEFTTAHSSKGLEADFVIIIGLVNGAGRKLGFPCQIADDPMLNMVLARQDKTLNAEERRLFYVASTRARNHVYLIADSMQRSSTFISEIQDDGYEINLLGSFREAESCPICKTGKIILRKGEYGEFYSCSNYPYCDYKRH